MNVTADLIIIGAGPGGYEIAAEQADAGKTVVLIEKDLPGGTCLNRGCIPTKCLCASADALRTVRQAANFGIAVGDVTADYAAAHSRMTDIVTSIRQNVADFTGRCQKVEAEASFTADGGVAAGENVYYAEKTIIATGSQPARLPFDNGVCITSDDLLTLSTLPASMAIIGGGVIGMEFASILNTYGVEVTVIEYCREILPPFDADVAKRLRSTLSRRGIKFILGAAVTAVEGGPDGKTVHYTGKKGPAEITVAEVLTAVGRRPVVPAGLAEAGIEVDRRGFIVTDENMMTTRPGVYAVGDCNGRLMLAHAATAQARRAIGQDVDLTAIPSAVFTHPECAMCGLTEEGARQAGMEVRTARAMFAGNGKAMAMGEAEGFVKTVFNASTGAIVGCHIIGPHAADLIQETVIPIAQAMTPADLRRYVHGHPTLSETLAATLA